MPKKIVQGVLGELIETGKVTAKAGKKAAGDVVKQVGKTVVGQKTDTGNELSGLDWLEKGPGGVKSVKSKKADDKLQTDQVKKLTDVDNRQSRKAYEQIQQQIQILRQQKTSAPRKYETGKDKFDEEQVKDPDSFFEKMKKKREEAEKSKDLPGTKKSLGGTGELARGTSG